MNGVAQSDIDTITEMIENVTKKHFSGYLAQYGIEKGLEHCIETILKFVSRHLQKRGQSLEPFVEREYKEYLTMYYEKAKNGEKF
jgi:hypothetical protein